MIFIVRVILPDGKNKMIVEEEYEADYYETEKVNNNLVLYTDDDLVVVEFHSYNWLSIKPVRNASVSSQEPI